MDRSGGPGLNRPASSARRSLRIAGACLLAVSAWLLVPRGDHSPGGPLHAVLVDVSASSARGRGHYRARVLEVFREEYVRARASDGEVVGIGYAAEVAWLFGPERPPELRRRLEASEALPSSFSLPFNLSTARDAASELAAALATLEAEPDLAAVRILTDGSYTGADPTGVLGRLARRGVSIEVEEPGPREHADWAVVRLDAPRDIAVGAPISVRVELELRAGSADSSSAARLTLVAKSGGEARVRELPIELSRRSPGSIGPRRHVVLVDLGPAPAGRVEVRAEIRDPRDPVAENDTAWAVVRGGDALLGLLVRDEEEQGIAPVPFGDLAGIEWIECDPSRVALQLDAADLVALVDVSPARLPGAAAAGVESFVRRGGHLFVCGGWSQLEPADGPLMPLIPLRPSSGGGPPREVVLFVDGSGSMAGEPYDWVREAALEIVELAPARDALSLRFFTDRPGPARLLRSRGASARAERVSRAAATLLSARPPGGPTDIAGSLRTWLAERTPASGESLVFLLSDGRQETGASLPADWFAQLELGRVRLEVVAVGAEADLEYLRTLVPEGRELHRAETLGDLTEIFRRGVTRGETFEWTGLSVRVVARGPEWGFEGSSAWPPYARGVRTRLAPGAELLFETSGGEPWAASARVGSGRVTAWVSSTRPGFAPEWFARADFFGPLLRAAGRRLDHPRLLVRGGELFLEGLPPGAPAMYRFSTASGAHGLLARAPGPGESRRRRGPLGGALDAVPPAETLVSVRLDPLPRDSGEALVLALPLPRAPEFRFPARSLVLPPNPVAGTSPARISPAGISNGGASGGSPHPGGPWLLALGIGLLLASVLPIPGRRTPRG